MKIRRFQPNLRHTAHVLSECGHSPHIEKPAEFRALLIAHLDG